MSPSGSGGSSDAGSSSGDELDEESAALIRGAPAHAQVGRELERHVAALPAEVCAALSDRGATVVEERLLKVSFHATFLVDLCPPLRHDSQEHDRVIVQVLGAELGDKALFGRLSAGALQAAAALATRAGVRVPTVFAVGQADTALGVLDFVVEEFIVTQTVEDEVVAPPVPWAQIRDDVEGKMHRTPVVEALAEPLPHFANLAAHVQWLLDQVPPWDHALRDALAKFQEGISPEPSNVALLHQDFNRSNVLCSERPPGSGAWALDAVIDWESAALADPRALSAEEPWATARRFALVAKGADLAARYARGALPRCQLDELVKCYDRAARALGQAGLLPYQPWARRVRAAQLAADAAQPRA